MRRVLLLLLVCLPIPACIMPGPDEAQRYATWTTTAAAAGWRACDAPEFLLLPPDRAAAIVPTLRVVRRLRAMGIMDGDGIRSGYRSAALNQCSGGSDRSRHVLNNALDFDLTDDTRVAALCAFWRTEGPALAMGLGFYTPTKIHLDTNGYRTWGTDHRRGTSLCVVGPAGQSAVRASRTQTP